MKNEMSMTEQLRLEKQRIEKSAIAPRKRNNKSEKKQKKPGPKPNPNLEKNIAFGVRLNEKIVNHVRILSIKNNQSQRTILELALMMYLESVGEQHESI